MILVIDTENTTHNKGSPFDQRNQNVCISYASAQGSDCFFWDDADGGWFSTTGKDPSILLRAKEDYDGAEPTPSAVSVLNLLSLSHLVERPEWTAKIEEQVRRRPEQWVWWHKRWRRQPPPGP